MNSHFEKTKKQKPIVHCIHQLQYFIDTPFVNRPIQMNINSNFMKMEFKIHNTTLLYNNCISVWLGWTPSHHPHLHTRTIFITWPKHKVGKHDGNCPNPFIFIYNVKNFTWIQLNLIRSGSYPWIYFYYSTIFFYSSRTLKYRQN